MKKWDDLVVIFDTNCLISAALIAGSVNAQALDKVFRSGTLAFSRETFAELVEVLYRSIFDNYLADERRTQLVARIERNATFFTLSETIRACRDPKDNMFLELALVARVSCIVSGDNALLELHPFRNIPILSPADFLKNHFRD